jgi:biopolymer transport protein ExbB
MLPIILCSVAAVAIIAERLWSLQRNKILPKHLVAQVWHWARQDEVDEARIQFLKNNSPLGRIIATGLVNRHHAREIMKESIEDAGRHIVPELERFLNTLGTIAAITPLLGLLGTVVGMIDVFTAIIEHGVGDPSDMAEGISKALITTAAGLSVAIPSLFGYRYLRGHVNELVVSMEQESLKLIEVLHGERGEDEIEQETDSGTKE